MLHFLDLADIGLYGLEKWSELWSTAKAHEMPVHRIPFDAQDIAVLLLNAAGELVAEAVRGRVER